MRIAVRTTDRFLYEKIRLLCLGTADVVELRDEGGADVDLLFYDARFGDEGSIEENGADADGRTVYITDGTQAVRGALPYPFSFSELRSAIEGIDPLPEKRLFTSQDFREVSLDGVKISLTEVEARLLSALLGGEGDFVSREALMLEVWGESDSGTLLNVYIHYLREKLEGRGERVIISSRRHGYKIDARFLGGDALC